MSKFCVNEVIEKIAAASDIDERHECAMNVLSTFWGFADFADFKHRMAGVKTIVPGVYIIDHGNGCQCLFYMSWPYEGEEYMLSETAWPMSMPLPSNHDLIRVLPTMKLLANEAKVEVDRWLELNEMRAAA